MIHQKQKANHPEDFSGIRICETSFFKKGSGICLPPIGVFVSKNASLAIKQHEYGHFLQYQEMGFFYFYFQIGLPSLWSATFFPKLHHQRSFERDANKRSRAYFGTHSALTKIEYWLD